jgi:epoxyqueuosine reductase QueG
MDLCTKSDEAWRPLLKGSAMRRAGMPRIRRALAYAAAHLPRAARERALDALEAHPSGAHHAVRGAIAWARRADAD